MKLKSIILKIFSKLGLDKILKRNSKLSNLSSEEIKIVNDENLNYIKIFD